MVTGQVMATFPKNARSLSCSATWRRNRNSSVRSAALNGSSATHRANELSTTDNSAATSAIVLPVSITRCAASVLNSNVNLRLVAPISDILPADQRSACQVSTNSGEPHNAQGDSIYKDGGWIAG